jgi:hypothetical protein
MTLKRVVRAFGSSFFILNRNEEKNFLNNDLRYSFYHQSNGKGIILTYYQFLKDIVLMMFFIL